MFFDNHAIKLEINNKKGTTKYAYFWKLRKTLLSNPLIKAEIIMKIKYFELDYNKNSTHKNLWATTKAVLREKFIILNIEMSIN